MDDMMHVFCSCVQSILEFVGDVLFDLTFISNWQFGLVGYLTLALSLR
jgi:hypothetical protein